MCSFLATNITGDHLMRENELRTLLWITEGLEPTKKKILAEFKTIDINSDGSISMLEWIQYLASVDPVVKIKVTFK